MAIELFRCVKFHIFRVASAISEGGDFFDFLAKQFASFLHKLIMGANPRSPLLGGAESQRLEWLLKAPPTLTWI